ncbi:UNVERIFIED_CONTAM: hypothetical protein LK11_16290 [Mumia flava]
MHRPRTDEWARVRDIRVRSIRDFPLAFLEPLEDALERDEAGWRDRVRRNLEPDALHLVARWTAGGEEVLPDRWVATMLCFVTDGPPDYLGPIAGTGGDRRANLVGVWVAPEARGGPVGPALLEAICAWVRDEQGLDALHLHVHERNPRAIAFYRRHGFVLTGESIADPRPDGGREVEMVRRL